MEIALPDPQRNLPVVKPGLEYPVGIEQTGLGNRSCWAFSRDYHQDALHERQTTQ